MAIHNFPEGVSIDEAHEKSGNNFNVVKIPMFYDHNGNRVPADRTALVREDSGRMLGEVAGDDRYNIFQNDSLRDFGKVLSGLGGASTARAGNLFGGQKVFYQFDLGEYAVGGKDKIKKFLTLTNIHSGKDCGTFGESETRIVCGNTFARARTAENTLRLRHTSSLQDYKEEASRILSVTREWAKQQQDIWDFLAMKKFGEMEFSKFLDEVLPPKEDSKNKRTANARDTIKDFFHGGIGADMFQDSAWNALNAVTQYVDHEATVRVPDGESREEYKLDSIMFGRGAEMKQSALESLMEYVPVALGGRA